MPHLLVYARTGPSASPTVPAPHMPALPSPRKVASGPLARWLLHPGATEHRWWRQLTGPLLRQEGHLALAAAVVVISVLTVLAVGALVRRGARRRGRWIQIRPPVGPQPGGGLALWRQLTPLLSARATWTGPRPPVGFEVIAAPGGTTLALWVSPSMPAAAVARAVATAWPGASTATGPAPLLAAGRGTRRRVSAGRVRLSVAEWFPLAPTQHSSPGPSGGSNAGGASDPLRGLLEALTDLPAGATGVLQVLARPAGGRRLARARRAARAARLGLPARSLPLRLPSPRPAGRPRSAGGVDGFALDDARQIAGKLTDTPLFQVAIRVAVTSSAGSAGSAGRAGRRARRLWLRQIAAALGLLAGRNQLILTRAHRAAAALGNRRLGRSMLLSVGELAAIAHLPAEPDRHGITVAAARSVPPPAQLAHA